jgi:hypothetical protein
LILWLNAETPACSGCWNKWNISDKQIANRALNNGLLIRSGLAKKVIIKSKTIFNCAAKRILNFYL